MTADQEREHLAAMQQAPTVSQLCTLFNQLKYVLTEREKNLHAAGRFGSEDDLRQDARALLKQDMLNIWNMIAEIEGSEFPGPLETGPPETGPP